MTLASAAQTEAMMMTSSLRTVCIEASVQASNSFQAIRFELDLIRIRICIHCFLTKQMSN